MNVLVVAAHPDDELLGVGGTIAWHIAKGDQVRVAVMCEGLSARFSAEGRYEVNLENGAAAGITTSVHADVAHGAENGAHVHACENSVNKPRWYVPERLDEVRQETREAARILGVTDLHLKNLPDQGLDRMPLSEVAKEVEQLVADFQPEIVYTHFGGDINRDHRVLTEAVLVATRPYAAPSVKEILMFETPSSTEWGSPYLTLSFQPNAYVDITPFLERKIEAFNCYTGELRPFPHPRSPQALATRAQYWGSLINRESAEAFVVVRSTR
jgi:N-acetylglucosamine malate deacetylase 1